MFDVFAVTSVRAALAAALRRESSYEYSTESLTTNHDIHRQFMFTLVGLSKALPDKSKDILKNINLSFYPGKCSFFFVGIIFASINLN